MLSEEFIASIRAEQKSANTAIAKDVGIYVRTLHPTPTVKSTFKKSSTPVNALASNSTHIFAAQADKAVVHVYSRERGNQEALIAFPERIQCLALVGDGVLVLGTAEGRIILWEVCTGRQVSTPAAHLQAVSCIATTAHHLTTGSEDSNIHVWSLAGLLSSTSIETHEPLRSLSNHRAPITSLVMGHSATPTNICVSASKDSTCIVWNYQSGDLLRTFLLPSAPLCLTLDPCDRAVYVGSEDGSIQCVEFISSASLLNPLFDQTLQSTPTQITMPPWTADSEIGEVGPTHCININYDGTHLLSGHTSGKIVQWDIGRRGVRGEVADLNAPVTNLIMMSPFPKKRMTKTITVVKPKLGEGHYTFTSQLTGMIDQNPFEQAVQSLGFAQDMLEGAISKFYSPAASTSIGDDKLRKENEELWQIVNEQRDLQKITWEKYAKLKAG